ncbi:MAG: BMP family ABC transporter substrate-binding protein [Oscillospiraceae bacterium]|nr:BMP family ABC transporter substrate-binding protein [Oscillospiraceae bacterium]
MKMRKMLAVLLVLVLVAGLAACAGTPAATPTPAPPAATPGAPAETPTEPADEPLHIGIVLSLGGLGDRNFNDAAFAGMQRAEQELGITFDYVEPSSPSDFLPFLRTMAETQEYDLIIAVGFLQAEALTEVSEDFPNQRFTHIDSRLDLPNVSGRQTRWQDQTFLAGVMAGLGTLSDEMPGRNPDANVLGVILGMDDPVLRMGIVGFTAGATFVNPDVEVLTGVVGDFNDPGRGREVALAMYVQGADFIQAIAGASAVGVFNASAEAGRYSFAAGMTVNYIEPDHIVGTSHRDIGAMVFDDIQAVVDGTWHGGFNISGLKEGSVAFDTAGSNVVIPAYILAAIEEVRMMVVNGELVPPATEDALEDWIANNTWGGR